MSRMRPYLENLHASLDLMADALAKHHDVVVTRGRTRYGDTYCTLELKVSLRDSGGAVLSKEAAQYQALQAQGKLPDVLHKTFHASGEQFRVIGYNPRAPRFPVLCENVATKKVIRFTASCLAQAS